MKARQLEINLENIEIVRLLLHSFDGDSEKVSFWLSTRNLNIGGLAPWAAIASGRAEKIKQFILNAQDENGLPKPREWAICISDLERLDMKEFDDQGEGCVRVKEILK